jgi:hypothetical protein
MYYIFTTVTSVGFGDYYPKSDLERLFCVMMFLVAGAIFSIIHGQFLEMIDNYQELIGDLD